MSRVIDDKLFSAVYKYSPIGLVILNDQMGLVDVNDQMFNYFSLPPADYKGRKFGEVFRCAVLTEGGPVCSRADECVGCVLMEGIWKVLTDGQPFIDTTVLYRFKTNDIVSKKWFRVSASPVRLSDKKYAVASFVDVTNEKIYEGVLKNKLTVDMVTNPEDMHSLMGVLSKIAGSSPGPDTVSLGVVEFDDFKMLNGLYGHELVEEVLTALAEIAGQAIRKQDIIGKYGEDGFLFIFPGVDIHISYKIIKRIHDTLKKRFAGRTGGYVSFSAGFMEMDKKKLETIPREDILKTTERYLADARSLGKHRFVSEKMVMVL